MGQSSSAFVVLDVTRGNVHLTRAERCYAWRIAMENDGVLRVLRDGRIHTREETADKEEFNSKKERQSKLL